jgi:hypothetical protein
MRQPDTRPSLEARPPGYWQKPCDTPKSQFCLKIAKKAEFCYFLGMATRPLRRELKNMDIKKIKVELQQELMELDTVQHVFWEYLDFFTVETSNGVYHLGNENGLIGWNDPEGREVGETIATSPRAIAYAFENWLLTK